MTSQGNKCTPSETFDVRCVDGSILENATDWLLRHAPRSRPLMLGTDGVLCTVVLEDTHTQFSISRLL